MSIAECVVMVQTGGGQTYNPTGTEYFLLALIAVVLGLFVLVFIRTSGRRASRKSR